MLKGRVKGIYLHGRTYWFAKQVNGRRSFVSLETDDYLLAAQRAPEIMDSPKLQPAQSFMAEVERFLKHKFETNRYSKMRAESKRSCLLMFADNGKNIPPANITSSHCKAYYDAAKARVVPSTAESYMFTLRSFFNWCVRENLCRRNPVVAVQLDRIDRKGKACFANFELAQRLIHNAPNDDLQFILFCGFHAGMRKMEIVEAVPGWLDLAARTVEIRATETFRRKDRDARTAPLTDQFVDFLKRWGLRSPYVLQPNVTRGRHRYRFDFRRAFGEYMKVQGVP
ncbi:MAG: phage integrase SAM-like domain-containing protein [Chthoniobacterales bacterium]|nr:phage integrase SAM-like domain-containing protein [Chthoniobacterales bacterium]